MIFNDGVFEKEAEIKNIPETPIVEATKPVEKKMTFKEKSILTLNYMAVIIGLLFIIYLIYFYVIAKI